MKIAALLVIGSVILCGCNNAEKEEIGGKFLTDGISGANVTLHTLEDGTRCAVLIGSGKGAISCDWIKRKDNNADPVTKTQP